MKKTFLVLSGLLALNFATISCGDDRDDDNEIVISENQLPDNAKKFLSTYFSDASVSRVEKENVADDDGTLYEVRLSNGFQIDFDTNGNWTGIDGNGKDIPAAVLTLIPTNILQYFATSSTIFRITEIEKKSYGYKVEINNSTELRFDTNGNKI